MSELFSLAGKVAVVTGASKEIGQAIAMLLAEHGAAVAVTARTPAPLERLAIAVRALGRRAAVIPADLTRAADRERIVAQTVAELGGLDILVNVAGGGDWANYGWALTLSEAQWQALFALNAEAPFFLAQAAARVMRERGGGRIVNISSGAGHHAAPRMLNYGAAKAALENASQTLAVEWARFGIRVNVVVPGLIDTENARQSTFATPEREQHFLAQMPLGRIGLPRDVAAAVLYFVSPASEWVTGATLVVNGGARDLRSFG